MASSVGKFAWHVHHEQLAEKLLYSITTRRKYIREYKHSSEIPVRLRLLKPVKNQKAAAKIFGIHDTIFPSDPNYKKLEALHKKECPNCPWNGYTIFPPGYGKDPK